MAIVVFGHSKCAKCGKTVEETDSVVAFPAFVVNEADPIYLFSDAVFHDECFADDPESELAAKRFSEWSANTGPGHRKCEVCRLEVQDPDDYLLIDHLSSNQSDPLFEYNFTHLHRSHLRQWQVRSRVVELLEEYVNSDVWGGQYLEKLIAELNQ